MNRGVVFARLKLSLQLSRHDSYVADSDVSHAMPSPPPQSQLLGRSSHLAFFVWVLVVAPAAPLGSGRVRLA